jgi:tetratricopeptide (TPR) repeat protein
MYCGNGALALWYVCIVLGGDTLARAAGFTHWLVTEEGKIEFQIGSPYNLRQHFNLHALLQQEEHVATLQTLRDELLNFRDTFEIFGHYDSFEESFFARDPDCRNLPSITTFDLYISTVLPIDHKDISLSDHLDPADNRFPGEPYCITPLDYSIYALDHLEGVQDRYSLTAPAEESVLPSVNMNIETFGNLVHQALEKNSTSWVLLDLATLYWRARGNMQNAVECIRRALHFSPRHAADIAYLNLANVLHRSDMSSDAIVPLGQAIEISPDTSILHYTLGNVYVSMAKFNESISEYRYSLSLEPTSEQVLSVYSSVLCEVRKIEASMEYGRKLDETQAKLDKFYDKVDLVKRAYIVEKGHRGQWDIDTTRWTSGGCGLVN